MKDRNINKNIPPCSLFLILGRMYGADDFLPVLTYVIAQCDMLELDTEIEYMMELLDPSLLHGEGNILLSESEEQGSKPLGESRGGWRGLPILNLR